MPGTGTEEIVQIKPVCEEEDVLEKPKPVFLIGNAADESLLHGKNDRIGKIFI